MSQPFVTSAPVAVRAGMAVSLPSGSGISNGFGPRGLAVGAGALGAAGLGLAAARMLRRDGQPPRRLTRRTALKQIALGTAAFSLGLQRSPAPTPPLFNNNLGLFLDITLNGTPIVAGIWYTICTDYSNPNCSAPIWKNLTAISGSYVNNNFAGNNAGFSSSGGTSDMVAGGLPLTTGKLYSFTWNAQILNSLTNNDWLDFLIAPNVVIDRINRVAGRVDRTVIIIAQDNMGFIWRFNKYATPNTGIQFRVDNLRINELPVPTLHVEPYDATHTLIWWDSAYGNEAYGTGLWENNGDYLNWVPNTLGTAFSDATRYGKVYPNSQQTKFFRLQVNGSQQIF